MDPAALKFLLDEIGRKFDEADARFDRLFARLQQPARGSTSFPCNGDSGAVSTKALITSTDPDAPLGSGADSIPTHTGEGPLEPAHGDVAVGGLDVVGAVPVPVDAATRRRTPTLGFAGNYSQPHDAQTSAVEEAMAADAGDPARLDQLSPLDPYAEDDITSTMPTRCSTLVPTPTPTAVIKAAVSATSAKPAASTCSSASAAQGVDDCGSASGRLHRVPRRLPRPCEVPHRGLLCDLLCPVPSSMEDSGWADNQDCGVSCTFGADVVADFLRAHDMDLVCRAHQVVEDGYEFVSDRQLVTVFPAPNYCGEFHNAAVMTICSFTVIKPETGSSSSSSLGCSTKCPSQALHNIVKPSPVAVVTIAGTPSSTLIDAQVVFGEMQPTEHNTLMTATIELRFVLWHCFILDWVATQQRPPWPPPVQLVTGIQLRPVPWPSLNCYAGLVWLIKSLDQMAGDILPKPPWLAFDPDNLFRVDYCTTEVLLLVEELSSHGIHWVSFLTLTSVHGYLNLQCILALFSLYWPVTFEKEARLGYSDWNIHMSRTVGGLYIGLFGTPPLIRMEATDHNIGVSILASFVSYAVPVHSTISHLTHYPWKNSVCRQCCIWISIIACLVYYLDRLDLSRDQRFYQPIPQWLRAATTKLGISGHMASAYAVGSTCYWVAASSQLSAS